MTDEHNTTTSETNPESVIEQPTQEQNVPLQNDSAEETPPVKKTPKDFIIERQLKRRQESEDRIRELETKLAELQGGPTDTSKELDVSQDFLEHTRDLERRMEIKDFVAENPAFAQYKDKMMKWAKHDAYARVPVEQLAYAVAGPEMFKQTSGEVQQATLEAQSSKVTGGSVAPMEAPKPKGYSQMTNAEFMAEVNRVKSRL